MWHYFDITRRHPVTVSNKNHYISPADHPTRILREHDFVYMLEGIWKIGQEGEQYELRADDVLILEAGKSHYGLSLCAPGTKTIFVHTSALDSDRESPCCLALRSHISAANNPAVKRCFEQIAYAKSCHDETMASVYFDALLFELHSSSQLASRHSVPEQIRQLISTSDRVLSNREVADELHISLKSAEQQFKRAFGKTIHRYQMEMKIENAKFCLTNFPDMRLQEIGENLGFYDEFHFSKQFKKYTGRSPGSYRKR